MSLFHKSNHGRGKRRKMTTMDVEYIHTVREIILPFFVPSFPAMVINN